MEKDVRAPKRRSAARLYFGAKYYTLRRYFVWIFGGIRFAKVEKSWLPHKIFSHATPLLRKLKDVQMHLQYNKITNLRIAVQQVNGVMLRSGETFSYWKLIGKPTKHKGYLEGMVLRSGQVTAGVGGGLCQLSNLIYWMTLHTPLTVVERHRHSYDVFPDAGRTQPFGSGATCFYNYGDLTICNDTVQTYQLHVWLTESELAGAWLCDAPAQTTYEIYEKNHVIKSEYWGGYTRHNTIYRKMYDAQGRQLRDEFVTENHAVMMYAPFLDEPRKT